MDARRRILKQLKMGTTEILVLSLLAQQDRYGYEISREVADRSDGFFDLKQGFLYPTLQRMENEGLVQSYWRESDSGGPRRKYYHATEKGGARLREALEAWREFHRHFTDLVQGRES